MLRKHLFLVLLLIMSPCRGADIDAAHRAFESGDYDTALKILLPLAESGLAEAQDNLGWMYKNGVGVRQDYGEALIWIRKAAEQDDVAAQYNLGTMYEKGLGIKVDYQEAANWYRKAAEQGQANAQFSLAEMYLDGYGVSQDYVQAYAWLVVVVQGGVDAADTILEEISFEMEPEEIEAGRRLGSEWFEKYGSDTSL